MVELLGVKFAQNGLIIQIFAAPSAPQSIWSFRTTLYIKFEHMLQFFLKFPCFRIFLQNDQFSKNYQKCLEIWTIKTQKSTFYCVLANFSLTMVEFQGPP